MLPIELPARAREFIERLISVARGHIEAGHSLVPFAFIATRHGVWAGQAPIEPDWSDEKKRTFGEVTLQRLEAGIGRFGKLLPGKDEHPEG